MRRELHVRFCEGGGVQLPSATRLVVGFEHREEATRFLTELRERFAQFGLTLHPDKTRLIEFGRSAARNRRDRGDGKPETFNFLGFTHACSRTRKGQFTVLRTTMRRRWQAKLQAVKAALRRRLHAPIPDQGAYLRSIVAGHARYYAVPRNAPRVHAFRHALVRLWWAALRRRSQNRPRVVGTDAPPEHALAPDSSHLPSVPEPAPRVSDPR